MSDPAVKIYHSLPSGFDGKQRALALGVFDGLHMGHQALLRELLRISSREDLCPAVMTFSCSRKGAHNCLLPDEEKITLLAEQGIAEIFMLELDEKLRSVEPEDFLQKCLLDLLGVRHFVLGRDAKFGAGAKGDVAYLKQFVSENDLKLTVFPDVFYGDDKVSSTRIRELLRAGKIAQVNAMLTRPYSLGGIVEPGRKLGRKAGFPTTNFLPAPERIVPALGVYATIVTLADGRKFPGITNIGFAPTVTAKNPLRVETYIYDFSADLYGQYIEVELLSFVRPEERFASVAEMQQTVQRDMQEVAAWHSQNNS